MQGIKVEQRHDQHGPIQVFDDGLFRFLRFGDGGEQSRIDINNPHCPVYQYTQSMLMALVFLPRPAHATILGLGGGMLVHALHHYDESLSVDIAELRADVADIAYNHFMLPRAEQLRVTIADATDFLSTASTSTDLIFADIYNDDGMQDSQLADEFIRHCHRLLSDEGILVLNLWDEGKGLHPLAQQRIEDSFGNESLCIPVPGGNLISFSFKSRCPEIQPRRLQPAASRLGKKLNFPARKLLNTLKPF